LVTRFHSTKTRVVAQWLLEVAFNGARCNSVEQSRRGKADGDGDGNISTLVEALVELAK
jgi:hypothetical protein